MADRIDGRNERMSAFGLEMQLRSNPEVTRRREEYYRRVASARAEAKEMGIERVIDRLIEHNPAYIRSLLETEDECFGEGALFDRYARTFCSINSAIAARKTGA